MTKSIFAQQRFSQGDQIWQGDQISPLFHEDAQDDQAINLIILPGDEQESCTTAQVLVLSRYRG
jgi:hypothetical protein